jgi:DNA-binding transcriptional LysR family regulator
VLTPNEPTLMREATLTGAGLAYMREAWIAQDVAAGRLVSVLSEWMPSDPRLVPLLPRAAEHSSQSAGLHYCHSGG